jgi:hypothetical protein
MGVGNREPRGGGGILSFEKAQSHTGGLLRRPPVQFLVKHFGFLETGLFFILIFNRDLRIRSRIAILNVHFYLQGIIVTQWPKTEKLWKKRPSN